jgi:pimeloyl-ACP methyl ester carboxylesterase
MHPVDTVTRDGLVFDLTTAGPAGGEPVVLLHGFPQSARCWDAVTPALAAAGLRTVAPDQRGYSPGARPAARAAYRLSELVADAAAVAEAVLQDPGLQDPGLQDPGLQEPGLHDPGQQDRGQRESGVHVVGHDWGAVVAWALAGLRPELVRTVTGLSVPPPGAFRAALLRPRQALASWYVAMFQVPGLAERVFARPAGRPWSPALVAMLVRSGQTRERAERDAAGMADPAALTAAVNWYRALPLSMRDEVPRATAPALYVWSDGDTALTRDAAELAPRHVAGPFRYVELRGVSHWIPDEVPDALAELLLEHVAANPAG